jgi:hypothetical protein
MFFILFNVSITGMKKKFFALFFVMFMISASGAALESLEITINVEKDGAASVTEKYTLMLRSYLEVSEFEKKIVENASSISAWENTYHFFYPHINREDVLRSEIYSDPANREITLTYYLKSNIARVIEDLPRSTEWEIRDSVLKEFISGGTIQIPEGTRITFVLPSSAQIRTANVQGAEIMGNVIIFSRSVLTNVRINYSIPKGLAPNIEPVNILEFFSDKESITAIAAVALIIISLGYWKKKEIGHAVENYIVEHSEIEGKDSIDFELESE